MTHLKPGDRVRYLQDPNHPDRPRVASPWIAEVKAVTDKMVSIEVQSPAHGPILKHVRPENLEKVWR